MAPILLGFVLKPMVEGNFRRALLMSRGNMEVFIRDTIGATIHGAILTLSALQTLFALIGKVNKKQLHVTAPIMD
jgi:TctA family transporter